MPAEPRPQPQPTDAWDQLRLLVSWPEQATYQLLHPVVLFGQSARSRAREIGVPERSLRRKNPNHPRSRSSTVQALMKLGCFAPGWVELREPEGAW